MRYWYDYEKGRFVSEQELRQDYETLKQREEVDGTFEDYVNLGDVSEGGVLEDAKAYARRMLKEYAEDFRDAKDELMWALQHGNSEDIAYAVEEYTNIAKYVAELEKYA